MDNRQYDLELLEDMITVTLARQKNNKEKLTVKFIKGLEENANQEVIRIRKRMKAIVRKPVKDKFKERYFQHEQQDLISLINVLIKYIKPRKYSDLQEKPGDDPLLILYKRLFHLLKGLLEHIENNCQQYFNQDEAVPASYLLRSQKELKTRLFVLQKRFAISRIHKKLSEIVFAPIEELVKNDCMPVSYRHFLYIKKLMHELEELDLHRKTRTLFFTPLIESLAYMDFNCAKLVSHLLHGLYDEVNAAPERSDKILLLIKYLKELNQLPVKPGMSLIKDGDSFRKQMSSWINEEIKSLEKENRLLSVAPFAPKDEVIVNGERLHFGVGVPVMAIIGRSACDSKLLLNSKKRAAKIFSNVSSTIGTEQPTFNSIMKKSSNPEPKVKEAAIGKLHEMIRWVMKY